MTDNKELAAGQDRSRVAVEPQFEVSYFAGRHGITTEEAREILRAAGTSRQKADALAERVAK